MGKKKCYVIGCGITKFLKPQSHSYDYTDLAREAATKALEDAGISYSQVKEAVVGYVYGDTLSGQCILYDLGITGIPIHNVNNGCATGAAAIYLARQLINLPEKDCILVLGFEKLEMEKLMPKYLDRSCSCEKFVEALSERVDVDYSNVFPQFYESLAQEYMESNSISLEHFAKVAEKSHKHAVNNPYARSRTNYSKSEIMNSPKVSNSLTKLQLCLICDGAACIILASERFVRKNRLQEKAVEVLGIEMMSELPSSFDGKSMAKLAGYEITEILIEKLFSKTKLNIEQVNVIEMHDTSTATEIITYEALGLCKPGKAKNFIDRKDNTYGGKYVVNPSGGFLGRGHAPGATGIAQCCEVCWQLRGEAEGRQVKNARLALQHNITVVALYRMGLTSNCKIRNGIRKIFRKNKNIVQTSQTTNYNSNASESKRKQIAIQNIEKFSSNPEEFLSYPIFRFFNDAFKCGKIFDELKNVKGIYGIKIKKENSTCLWVANMNGDRKALEYNSRTQLDILFIISETDMLDVFNRVIDPWKAFVKGKIKIVGDLKLAQQSLGILRKLLNRHEEIRAAIKEQKCGLENHLKL